jgi:hypothetical protein
VTVEKLTHQKMAEKPLHLGSPTNDFLGLGRHFLSPEFSAPLRKMDFFNTYA